MERKYSTLKVGSPLASGDTLLLHGIHYTVEGYGTRFFLSNKDGWDNSEVFRKLSREKDKYAWAAQFGSTCSGDFPEFKDLASLTKFVIAIYEKPEFKAGDYVTINERDGLASDYPASFVDDMAGYSGKTFLVTDLSVTESGDDRKFFNGDPHWYYLKTPSGYWTWHSSMFRKATEEEILAVKGVKGDSGAKCDRGSTGITGSGAPQLIVKSFEEFKEMGKTLDSMTDCTLRLPKNTTKTFHINL